MIKNKVHIGVRLNEKQLKDIDREAKKRGETRSETLRRLIEKGLEWDKNQQGQ